MPKYFYLSYYVTQGELLELFTLTGCELMESFDPNSSIAHRILAFGKVKYRDNRFFINSNPKKFNTQMLGAPLLKGDGFKACGIHQFLIKALTLGECKRLIPECESERLVNQAVVDWGLAVLRPMVIAVSFKCHLSAVQTKRMIAERGRHFETTKGNEYDVARTVLLNSIMATPFARLSPEDLELKTTYCYEYIEELLGDKDFLIGGKILVADIVVFSHLSRILLPGFSHSEIFLRRYPRIVKWMKRVAVRTIGEHTVFPSFIA